MVWSKTVKARDLWGAMITNNIRERTQQKTLTKLNLLIFTSTICFLVIIYAIKS